ncbi:MAG: energy transducer TonB [Gammaproteobacteria bacterium]|nr:MAG: energy transducer TonB [Gammaproteobacteria bacterium]
MTQALQIHEPVLELEDNDRIGLTFFGSFLAHMVIILGITFTLPHLRELQGLPTMEITLVQTHSNQTPDNPDYLAQANQDGGGNDEKRDIARNPLPITEVGEKSRTLPAHRSQPQPHISTPKEQTKLLTQDQAQQKISQPDPRPKKKTPRTQPARPGITRPSQRDAERTRLNAEISRFWQEYQQQPKRKFLNARTREYKYAAYMEAWRAKVERVGNLNYPEAARQQHLTGTLVLDVALKPDGNIHSLEIMRSSGQKLLDDAAMRIVSLSAPFAPFPSNIRSETDILHITRTWKFNQGSWYSEH